jgi:serine/threonine-protein kinase RsbW
MHKNIKIKSSISNLWIVETFIDSITNEIGISKENYGKILVSTLEAVNNSIIHGNKSDPSKNVVVDIYYKKNKFKVLVKDEGKGFALQNLRDPTMPENIELTNGRGVFLMARLADKIQYTEEGNTVIMTFKT